MSELPQGWASVPIGDLIDFNPKDEIDDQTVVGFVPMPLMATGFVEPVRFEKRLWREVKKGYTQFADGDVLLAKITPCFENGKAGIACNLPSGVGAGSTEYFVCRPKPDALLAKYLLAYFKTREFLRAGEFNMTGSVGHKRVPKEYLLNREIALAPLPEQKRIADKLEALIAGIDTARARLDRVPAILKRFRQSVLAAATGGELTEDWRENNFEAELPWREVQVGDVGTVQLGRQRSPKYHQGKTMRPYLRVQNVFEDRLDLTDVMTMDFPLGDYEKYKLHPGDILLNEGQSPEYLGRPAIYRNEIPGACFTNTLIRFKASSAVLPEFALIVFRNHMHSGRYLRESKITTNIAHLSASRFSAVEFPLPPLHEQHEIVRRVGALFALADRVQARYDSGRAQVDNLIPALLAKAFRGELVPRDPDDEPADKLLKRLYAGAVVSSRMA